MDIVRVTVPPGDHYNFHIFQTISITTVMPWWRRLLRRLAFWRQDERYIVTDINRTTGTIEMQPAKWWFN